MVVAWLEVARAVFLVGLQSKIPKNFYSISTNLVNVCRQTLQHVKTSTPSGVRKSRSALGKDWVMPDVASRSDMRCARHAESEDGFSCGGEMREDASRRPDVTVTVV